MNHQRTKGFTLIELLVVIAIIGVLSTLAIVALGSARQKARDSKRLADLKQVSNALELYYSDNNQYPTAITPGQALSNGTTTYMAAIPTNPSPRTDGTCPNQDYVYTIDSSYRNYSFSGCVGTSTTTSASTSSSVVSVSTGGVFVCGQNISDSDGNSYGTVQIGTQCWMKQNLNVGTNVLCSGVGTTCATNPSDDTAIEKYCYQNSVANCTAGGGLYTWTEAMNIPASYATTTAAAVITTPHQGICPTGWHIPTDVEFNTMEIATVGVVASTASQYACDTTGVDWQRCADNSGTNSGGAKGAGLSLKAVSIGGNDLVGFSALWTGYRNNTGGTFANLSNLTSYWLATQFNATNARTRSLFSSWTTVERASGGYNKLTAFSLRCVKN